MANENKEIGELVRKCKILLLDIEGTTTSISFVKDKLFPYAEENVKKYLEDQWENKEVKDAVDALRKLSVEDKEKGIDGVVTIPEQDAPKEEQIEGAVNNIKWQMSDDRKSGPLKLLQGMIWKQGYDSGEIKGHVFNDVLPALEQWHSVDGQKVYIYSSGSVQAQKLLFGQTLVGDLLKYIDGHFDTAVGAKQESSSYKTIVEQIGCSPEDVLFLTDILKEAEAASSAGLYAALVCREGNAPLPDQASNYPVIQSMAQLTVPSKRKTDPQDGDQPAKILKTDTIVEEVGKLNDTPVLKESNEPEKMEVEDKEEKQHETVEIVEKQSETEVEMQYSPPEVVEVTDRKDISDSDCDVQPLITEVEETSSKEKTEGMDVEEKEKVEPIVMTEVNNEKSDIVNVPPSENGKEGNMKSPIVANDKLNVKNTEEQEPSNQNNITTVITEIVEVTNEKPSTCNVANIIEGMEPIVEEPNIDEDMDDNELQNVGEELTKECDEILSKVENMTNFDNICIKPLLKPIVEESMETESSDSNDIVDKILDTELELEMEKNANNGESTKNTEAADSTEVANPKEPSIASPSDNSEVKVEEKPKETITNSSDYSKDTQTENTESAENSDETKSDGSCIDNNPASAKDVSSGSPDSGKNLEDKCQDTGIENKASTGTNDSAPEEKPIADSTPEEAQVNGKSTNGVADSKQNGDSTNNEELKSRLSAENGKEILNGSNGDSKAIENGLADKKTESEVTEIKVKTIATDEPSKELIEQTTKA